MNIHEEERTMSFEISGELTSHVLEQNPSYWNMIYREETKENFLNRLIRTNTNKFTCPDKTNWLEGF